MESRQHLRRITFHGQNGLQLEETVTVFPDELPPDWNDLVECFRAAFAPIKIWKAAAVEYHRQGLNSDFSRLLKYLIDAITSNPDIEQHYRAQSSSDYDESMMEIFNCIAADELWKTPQNTGEIAESFRRADRINALHEYTWLIKGFNEIRGGQLRRAEDYFKNIFEAVEKKKKEKYRFGAHVGLGIVAFSQKKYPSALDHFVKAIQARPNCGVTLRVAIAACSFYLEQYDRARAALEKAIQINPSHVDSMVLLALLEKVTAQKDRAKKKDCRVNAFEYCVLASQIDSANPTALNQLANHYFFTWVAVDEEAKVLSASSIMTNSSQASSLYTSDIIQINGYFTCRITGTHVDPNSSSLCTIEIEPSLPSDFVGLSSGTVALEVKKLGQCERHVRRALEVTPEQSKEIISESHYILGRLYHSFSNFAGAQENYQKSLNANPEMTLSAFSLGQLHLYKAFEKNGAGDDLLKALERFDFVLSHHPEDKDTQAYQIFVRSFLNSETIGMEKLREIATGFPHETDLWLRQGVLRLKARDYANALKCYEIAVSTMKQHPQRYDIDPDIFLNMAVLQHSLGNLLKAHEYCILSINQLKRPPASDSYSFFARRFNTVENEVFYGWSKSSYKAVVSNQGTTIRLVSGSEIDAESLFESGIHILVRDVICKVESVREDGSISVISSISCPDGECDVQIRVSTGNFRTLTLTHSFNYARVLEDMGRTNAAVEIYLALISIHPTFTECYMRLSMVYESMGKFEESSSWLSRALGIEEGDSDVTISVGDLYSHAAYWDIAKKSYEKANTHLMNKQKPDSRSMLALGNLYFANIDSNFDDNLKQSYKYFHPVLVKDNLNVFAANGLGAVCAEKRELDVALEIFSKIRESEKTPHENTYNNLGHVLLSQGRNQDAIAMYQSAVKVVREATYQGEKKSAIQECLGFTYLRNKQFDLASQSLLRSLHLDPSALHSWFNYALVGEESAVNLLSRSQKSVIGINEAISELQHSASIFSALSSSEIKIGSGITAHSKSPYKSVKASQHQAFCLDNISKASVHRQHAQDLQNREELLRSQEEELLRERLSDRNRLRETKTEADERERKEKQEMALLKMKQLNTLQEKWTSSSTSATENKGEKSGPKRKNASSDVEYQSENDSLSDNNGGGAAASKRTKKRDDQIMAFDSDENVEVDDDDDEKIFGGMLSKPTASASPDSENDDAFISDAKPSDEGETAASMMPTQSDRVSRTRRILNDDSDEEEF